MKHRPNQSSQSAFVVLALVIVIVLFAAYIASVLNFAYSDGERVGYLQKLSRKGWVCKTYEGELAMTTVPGVAPTLWHFTVRDEATASEMNRMMGKRVVLGYEEHIGIPTNCYGDTSYFVNKLTLLDK